jgi:hypothetical protein
MHPKTEMDTLRAPSRIAEIASDSEWRLLLFTAFARDDQPNGTGVHDSEFGDPIHRDVAAVCKGLLRARDDLIRYYSMLKKIADEQPDPGGRKSETTPCIACAGPAVPQPKSGFCFDCYERWLIYRNYHLGDRQSFIHSVRSEEIDKLIIEQEADA